MTVLATIIVLGVLIFVHELGHFWAARAVGIRVERFSIGFGPRVFGFTSGDTEYILAAIPLGGYVKMAGMDDAMMESIEGGASQEPRRPSDRDYDSKPIWARTLVISAGVIMNMLFAFAAYTFVAGFWGTREAATTRIGEVRAEYLPAGTEDLGQIPVGATIVQIGDVEPEHWGDVRDAFLNAEPGALTVRTSSPNGSYTVQVPEAEDAGFGLAVTFLLWTPSEIGAVTPGGPADKGQIEADDQIVAVQGTPVETWYEFRRAIQARPEIPTEIELIRDGSRLSRIVTPDAQEVEDPTTGESQTEGAIGVYIPNVDVAYVRVGWGDAVREGYLETKFVTGRILGFLRDLVTGNVSPRSMGSIVTIGEASGQAADEGIETFLRFMALFSINLAVLNMLPIPVLDGGHLVFLGIEAVRGKPLSIEQRLKWSNVGFVVIMGIMVWALGNDILRLFGL